MSNTVTYSLVMLIAGVGIPIMAALNARLGTALGSPLLAVFILIVISAVLMTFYMTASGFPALSLPAIPAYYYLGGLFFILYIVSITAIAPHFGVGNAVFFVLLGQLVSSALIDHFGLFGAVRTPLDLTRLAGLVLMAVAVFLSVKRV
jgi:transporter family-2 protein